MATLFDITLSKQLELEKETLSMQEKVRSVLTQNQFEACDKIIESAADAVTAKSPRDQKKQGSIFDALIAGKDDLNRMNEQLSDVLNVKIPEETAWSVFSGLWFSELTHLPLVSGAVVLFPEKLLRPRMELYGWAIVAHVCGFEIAPPKFTPTCS